MAVRRAWRLKCESVSGQMMRFYRNEAKLMDARAKTIREILHSSDQYFVPFFQRNYSWDKKQWDRLRDDIVALTEDGADRTHFMGPLVCTPHNHVPGEVTPYQLIDGQQRLTTALILLIALRDVARDEGCHTLADEIMEDFVVHHRRQGLQRYRVVPRLGDREVLVRLIDAQAAPGDQSTGLRRAYAYFRAWLQPRNQNVTEERLRDVLCACTSRLSLVAITISGENPYEIFESLNSTGLPLEESDLIRNYIFMQVPYESQEQFNIEHWRPFEGSFAQAGVAAGATMSAFYRFFLMRNGEYSRPKSTYVDFRSSCMARNQSPVELLSEMQRFSRYDRFIRDPDRGPSGPVREELKRFASLELTSARPLLLHLLDRHEADALPEDELVGCIRDLAGFVIRRSICGESTRAYSKWFPLAAKSISDSPRLDLQAVWLDRGWPDDATFQARLLDFPIYRREPEKCRLILEMTEQGTGHREPADLARLTIEHVMPQTLPYNDDGNSWRAMLGEEWLHAHQRWLDTIGNLTLTGYNSELSNRPFHEKRLALAMSHVELNRYFTNLDRWDGPAIIQRGKQLAAIAAAFWPRPDGAPYQAPPDSASIETTAGIDFHADSPVFVIALLGVHARMVEANGLFIVLAGSTGRRHPVPSWTSAHRQQELVRQGKLVEDASGELYRFTEDVAFKSLSGAAAMVLARGACGGRDWKLEGTDISYEQWKIGQVQQRSDSVPCPLP